MLFEHVMVFHNDRGQDEGSSVSEQPEVTPADFDRLMEQTRAALRELRNGDLSGTEDEETEEIVGEGEAADGRIRVAAIVGGALKSVEVDPRAMRMSSEELGEQIVVAVNAALEDLKTKVSESAGAALQGFDPEALAEQMLELQDQSVRQMSQFTAGMEDMLGRIARAAGTAD
jgi:DNA-binding protein YbaB